MIHVTEKAIADMRIAIPDLITIEAEESNPGINKLILYFDGYDVERYISKSAEMLKSYDLDVIQCVPMGKTGDFHGRYKFRVEALINVPIPEPPQPQMPPRMKVPGKVSDKAMELLLLIQSGADVRVRWRHKVPTLTVNDRVSSDLLDVYRNELTQVRQGKIPNGFGGWWTIDVAQHILTHEKQVDSDEDRGVEDKITLSDEGKKFLEGISDES